MASDGGLIIANDYKSFSSKLKSKMSYLTNDFSHKIKLPKSADHFCRSYKMSNGVGDHDHWDKEKWQGEGGFWHYTDALPSLVMRPDSRKDWYDKTSEEELADFQSSKRKLVRAFELLSVSIIEAIPKYVRTRSKDYS